VYRPGNWPGEIVRPVDDGRSFRRSLESGESIASQFLPLIDRLGSNILDHQADIVRRAERMQIGLKQEVDPLRMIVPPNEQEFVGGGADTARSCFSALAEKIEGGASGRKRAANPRRSAPRQHGRREYRCECNSLGRRRTAPRSRPHRSTSVPPRSWECSHTPRAGSSPMFPREVGVRLGGQ